MTHMGAMRMTTATRLTERNWTLPRSVGRSVGQGSECGRGSLTQRRQSIQIDCRDGPDPDVSIPSHIGFGRSWFLLLCIHEDGIPIVPVQERRVDQGEVCLIALDRQDVWAFGNGQKCIRSIPLFTAMTRFCQGIPRDWSVILRGDGFTQPNPRLIISGEISRLHFGLFDGCNFFMPFSLIRRTHHVVYVM